MALQYASAIAPASVLAAPGFVFVPDDQGADDLPGQKDLTAQATAVDGATFYSAWKWDDTSWSGNNTGDACSLFDTDGDGKVNYSVCVTIATDAAVETSTRVYSCGDAKVDRCTSQNPVIGTEGSTQNWCSVENAPGQFPGGGTDTQATCNISQIAADLNIAGLSSANLINTCSYPSQEPNSDPSDCVLTPGNVDTTTATQVKNTNGAAADTNVADGGSVAIGTVAYDTATLGGNTATAGGTVTYYVELGDTSCTIAGATVLGTKTVTNGSVPSSETTTLSAPGTYELWAVYSGGPGNNGSTSPCGSETVVVILNGTSAATQVKNTNGEAADTNVADGGSVAIGTVAYDTATLGGNTATAGGTVTYYVEKDASCTIAGATVLGTKTVTNGSVPNSDTNTFASAGTYEFWAVYSGDANNNGSTSLCGSETVVVPRNSPTIATLATDGGIPGDLISDTATLTGASLPTTGNVTFTLYGSSDPTCVGEPIFTSTVAINANGTATSGSFAIPQSGTYHWIASYAGNTNNNPVAGICGAIGETTVIRQFNPEITTSLSSGQSNAPKITVLFGASVTDQATLTGGSATAGGSVTYTVYSNDTCTTVFASGGTKSVVNGVVGASDAVSFPTAGTFYWIASYSGDTSNAPSISACTDEVVTVTAPNIHGVKSVATNDGAFGPTSDAVPGDVLHYAITVTNSGDAAGPANVSDNISAILAHATIGTISDGGSLTGNVITWAQFTVAANGGTKTLTFTVKLDATFPQGTTHLPNTVVVVGTGSNCPASEGDANCDTDTGVNEFLLNITKSNNAPIVTLALPDGSTADLPTADEGTTVTYTLHYHVGDLDVANGVITDVLPVGVTYVAGSFANSSEFHFVNYNSTTRTLSWTAETVTTDGSVTYQAKVDVGASELSQPLTNTATIRSDQTEPDSDTSDVFVPVIPQGETNVPTAPPTDELGTTAPSTPSSSLFLMLAVLGALVVGIGFVTPVPAAVRRRNRR